MGLFGLSKSKAHKFEFEITIANLQPWPDAGNRALAVGWQRGKKKRGATRSVFPVAQPGKLGNMVRFNEKFQLRATLYKSANGTPNPNNLGPFKKKCLILAILETDGRSQATAVLGRVVIDLAELAAVDKREVRYFAATCQQHIHAAVGNPEMLISIRTRHKLTTAGGVDNNGDLDDDGASMSTDTTGSRMTDSLSTFLRHRVNSVSSRTGSRYDGDDDNSEQDLRGFSRRSTIKYRNDTERAVSMNVIQESGEEAEYAPPGNRTDFRRVISTPPRMSHHGEQGGSLLTPVRPRGALPNQRSLTTPPQYKEYGLAASPRGSAQDVMQGSVFSSPGVPGSKASGSASEMNESMTLEIQQTAAGEVAVLMARSVAAQSRQGERAAHGAARRLVRTLACLGPQQAPNFAQHVLRQINSQLECSYMDLNALAFWWSNLAHMRALLRHAASTGTIPTATIETIVPQVQAMEKTAFTHVVDHLWEGFLLPVGADASAAAALKGAPATPASKRAQQEAASKRWNDALKLVHARLLGLQPFSTASQKHSSLQGHIAQLREQALVQCMKRLDALLFYHLVTQPDRTPADIMGDYDPTHSIWGTPGTPPPNLDEACLPFPAGVMSFGSGMSVKMTVTRLQQWATTEAGLSGMVDATGPGTALFPLLRAMTDLLMMPKDLLLEANIRQDVCQSLSLRTLRCVMETFESDEFAPDPISPVIVPLIKEDQLNLPPARPPLTDLTVSYKPPEDDLLLKRVTSGSEPSIEYDEDSEDELVGFSSVGAPIGSGNRFRTLHTLWCSQELPTANRRPPASTNGESDE